MKKNWSLSATQVWWMLAVLGFVIYSNTFRCSFVFDDHVFLKKASGIHHFIDIHTIWQAFNTRFVVGFSLALNYWLGKENVFGYHVFNLVVHVLNSFLVYQLVCLTFQTPRLKKGSSLDPKLIGFLTSLVFLTHPLQTQGVTYIWQRATSLAALFYIGALVFYVKSRLKASWKDYALCLLFAILGMFTKEIVFTLPLMILLYEFLFLDKKSRKIFMLIPILASLFIIPLTMTQASEKTLSLIRPNGVYFNKAESLVHNLSQMTRTAGDDKMTRQEFILTELNVLKTYLRLFVFPVKQSVDYDYPKAKSLLEVNTLLSFLLLLVLFFFGIFLLKNHPLNRMLEPMSGRYHPTSFG